MKIGLSYSRCVLDIVEGRVPMEEVLVIVARTDFDPRDDAQWSGIWAGYSGGAFRGTNSEWSGSQHPQEQFRSVSIDLWETGRLHQPRKFGWRPQRLPWHWLETVLPDAELESRPAVKEAWDRFKILAGLSGVQVKMDHQ